MSARSTSSVHPAAAVAKPIGAPAVRCFAVLPAAGVGARVGADRPKQYLKIAGRTVLEWSLQALLDEPRIAGLVVVVAPEDAWIDELDGRLGRAQVARVGGASRRDSVSAGIRWLRAQAGAKDQDFILVHDAARPGLERQTLGRLLGLVEGEGLGGFHAGETGEVGEVGARRAEQGALLGLPVVDTVKRADAAGGVRQTVIRDGLWLAQTPQMARCGPLEAALERHPEVTDEAAALEADGLPVRMVLGSPDNFKLTSPGDVPRMEQVLMKRMGKEEGEGGAPAFAIGQGYDVHALVPGRALIIGGVTIPHPTGLLGHSDADVLLHAITDAVLGAAGLGDIGRMFPDTDERHRGADSRRLLALAMEQVRERGWRIGNVDATVIAQQPRLAPHVPAMVTAIATALGCAPAQVNIKGKTNERLGFEGRSEGMVAQAAVLLVRA